MPLTGTQEHALRLKEILNPVSPTASPLQEGLFFMSERLMS